MNIWILDIQQYIHFVFFFKKIISGSRDQNSIFWGIYGREEVVPATIDSSQRNVEN